LATRIRARRALFIAGYVGFLGLGFWASTILHELSADFEAGPLAAGMFGIAFAAFVGFSAIPFVPGAEIGLGLLVALGAKGALLVYVGMIAALGIAFVAGRFVPPAWIAGALGALGLMRARDLVLTSSDLSYSERTRFLETHAPARWLPFLLRHRYVALGLLLNMPGNVILGGGGGIAFAAGACRLFSPGAFLLTILIAVAPIPLAFLLFGGGGGLLRS
jgi:hypothetical protein